MNNDDKYSFYLLVYLTGLYDKNIQFICLCVWMRIHSASCKINGNSSLDDFFDESCFFLLMFLEFSDAKAAIENILSRISFDPKYCTRLLHWLRNLDMKSIGKQEKTKKPGSHFTAKLLLRVFLECTE